MNESLMEALAIECMATKDTREEMTNGGTLLALEYTQLLQHFLCIQLPLTLTDGTDGLPESCIRYLACQCLHCILSVLRTRCCLQPT